MPGWKIALHPREKGEQMYLKKLELVGFKSFPNKTTLHFEPGITAIVGPNGTGKSNLNDAIRWVLGEQSAKSLRGSEMQDVIFNGTDKQEPLGMAEVTLTFDNSNKFFNLDHPEVAITRRIFRSGESEYLLNKSLVRLKDILDILLGTGIGAESYSLVAQGKIDLVLSSRPEDRRLVFDEAAGITKYKSQKRETMRKLEETEANLLRVNDIITEVKRQIGSLERQANKARRYKEVFEELKAKEITSASVEKAGLLRQKEEIIQALSALESGEAGLLESIKGEESKIGNRQEEIRLLEGKIMALKNEILNLDNLIVRNREHIDFNQERIKELQTIKGQLEPGIPRARNKLAADTEKLTQAKEEYAGLEKNIALRAATLKEKEGQFENLSLEIKLSLEKIARAKKEILELVVQIAKVKNEITDLASKQQIHLARQKRLELEKAKVKEEKGIAEDSLGAINQELEGMNKIIADLNLRSSQFKDELSKEEGLLNSVNSDIEKLERESLTLHSHQEFIEKLKTKYEDIGEAMNAVIYLDKLPQEAVNGLVIKVKEQIKLSDEDKSYFDPGEFKLSGEAKPIDLDTQKIGEKITKLQQELYYLENAKRNKEAQLEEIKRSLGGLEQESRSQDILLANKKAAFATAQEQYHKIKEEEDLIVLESADLEKEIFAQEETITGLKVSQNALEDQHRQSEEIIAAEQNRITSHSDLKEQALVVMAQTKAELEALNKRISSDQVTLQILEDTCQQDRDNLANIQRQVQEAQGKTDSLGLEIKDLEEKSQQTQEKISAQKNLLAALEDNYRQVSDGASEVVKKIEQERSRLDVIKNRLYQLQMQNKEADFKFLGLKDRLLEGYKVELEALPPLAEPADAEALAKEIKNLKAKLEAYGTVNLVAIEEYDELKKRYDFLIQQQTDLNRAKESLHEAITKINRTTRKMFLETFEKVRVEFRNYFRLLFNGGDAQVFLVDEQDPLESGIEIICRPPGKKLQNVLLLSGGEKSLSAIALIFAIFKVKPSPFCILDEIDAALDEANVDRYSRLLQEFIQTSQFIVITHNKRTIVNANVMYGITMEESGVSKIVSVKFAKDEPKKDKAQATAEPTAV